MVYTTSTPLLKQVPVNDVHGLIDAGSLARIVEV
jgi:hypothetical protein